MTANGLLQIAVFFLAVVALTKPMGAFMAHMASVVPLAKSAEITYQKLAKGPITAHAKLKGTAALIERLQADGRVEFPVSVDLRDGDGTSVATMTVRWNLRKRS